LEEGLVFGCNCELRRPRDRSHQKGAEIWLSDRAKEDIDRLGATQHKQLGWEQHDGIAMKGFPGSFTLLSVQ